jgi:TonB family protein
MSSSDPKRGVQGVEKPSSPPHGAEPEYHLTFVDSTLPPVSLVRQILQSFREPKVTVPKEYYRKGAGSAGTPPFIFVDTTLPPVSLFHQLFREPRIKVPKGYDRPRKPSRPPAEAPPPDIDPNQMALPFAPDEAALLGVSRPPDPTADWDLDLIDLDPEAVKWRRRTMYLCSLILHGLLVLLLVFSPDLLRRGKRMVGIPVEVAPKRDYSFLLLPPEVLRRLREPPPENSPLSDRNRLAQGRSPVINPNGLRMPYSLGNSKVPEIAGGKPPAAAPAPPPGGGASSQPSDRAANPAPAEPKLEAKNDSGLKLEDVNPAGGGGSGLKLPSLTPGQAIQQSVQSAARGRTPGGGSGSGSGGGYGDGNGQFQNLEPNFSTEGPIILSDTRGVDFGPYLARIVFVVRRNWYSVIPESARLGEKGRVGIVFEILKDGSVPQLRLVASSGSDALDRAALAGIRASIPFPPLPEEFTGNHLVLQFMFLYNLAYGQ